MTVLWGGIALGQGKNSLVNDQSFNKIYLEHLVKVKIDSVRRLHDCESLVNDSILYIASDHHARYMQQLGAITHMEDKNPKTKTPQLRAEFYGAVNYGVGENVLFTIYNAEVKGKEGEVFDTHTYEGVANSMVSAWVHSSGHFRNIIDKEYQVTGLTVAIDPATQRIYACQKFAKVYYRYQFKENPQMFPYSGYSAPAVANSFEGVRRALIPYVYDYQLRHDEPAKCLKCESLVQEQPFLTLRVKNNNFILRVENAEYVRQLTEGRRDGFAVEIVAFDEYVCGNPAYYTKPSRRNGQLKLNGKILQPLYRKDLESGYKKRKRQKDVKFIPYIFKSDSIAFFKRFGRFKEDKYAYAYFEIKLGRVPKDISGLWAHNLVYIQDRQICHIDYFTAYCGDLYKEYKEMKFIPASSESNFSFPPEKQVLKFTVPFQKGQYEFTAKDIQPFIASLENQQYTIDSVSIRAFSSIEGDSAVNAALQQKRAESIVGVMQKHQAASFPVSITTSGDWEDFYKQVALNPKWSHLKKMSRVKVQQEITKLGYEQFEPVFQKERRGEITLYYTLSIGESKIGGLLRKELVRLKTELDKERIMTSSGEAMLKRFSVLYKYAHHLVVNKKLSEQFLADVKMPLLYRDEHVLLQNFILYGYEFEAAFSKNDFWVKKHKSDEEYLVANCQDHVLDEFNYVSARFKTQELIRKESVTQENVQDILDQISLLEILYKNDSTSRINIDNLNFNLNVILLNQVFKADPMKYAADATKSIAQLHAYFNRYGLDAQTTISLARCAVFYQDINYAVQLLRPFATSDSVLAYLMPLSYNHPSRPEADAYYQELIALAGQMDDDAWCNMFIDECQIPFQALDHEGLRDEFCARCMEKNTILRLLLGKSRK